MISTNPLVRDKAQQLRFIVIPQLVILAFFVASKLTTWGAVFASGSNLFVELVSAGGGWVMLSLSTLAMSLLFAVRDSRSAVMDEGRSGFSTYPVSVASSAWFEVEQQMATAVRTACWLVAPVALLAIGSVAANISVETSASVPGILAFVLAVFVVIVVVDHHESALNFANVLDAAFSSSDLTVDRALTLKANLDAGRFNTAGAQKRFEDYLERLAEHKPAAFKRYRAVLAEAAPDAPAAVPCTDAPD